jgi:hypothetical protein
MSRFKSVCEYQPKGDQPRAIEGLTEGTPASSAAPALPAVPATPPPPTSPARHQDFKTTMIHAHVFNRGGKGIRSPMDVL